MSKFPDGLTVPQAACYLAARSYRCSFGTVRALAKSGRLRHFRPGLSGKGPMRFRESRLDEFLAAAEIGGNPESEPFKPARAKPVRSVPRTTPAPETDWLEEFEKAAVS